ncbi:MAG: hypothetical protein ACI4DY_13325 [Monoglobaceae bacterium]
MYSKYKMSFEERCELENYRATGLSPRQIRNMEREISRQREYIEWLESL